MGDQVIVDPAALRRVGDRFQTASQTVGALRRDQYINAGVSVPSTLVAEALLVANAAIASQVAVIADELTSLGARMSVCADRYAEADNAFKTALETE